MKNRRELAKLRLLNAEIGAKRREKHRAGVAVSNYGATIEDVVRGLRQLCCLIGGLALIAFTLLTTVVGITPAAAEDPGFVADAVAEDGVFVAPGRSDVDEAELEAIVQSLRFEALRVVVVAPNDPQPSNEAFARRIQEATDADVAIVFPPPQDPTPTDSAIGEENTVEDTVEEAQVEAYVIDDLQENHYRALQEAREFSDPARSVEAFAEEIQAEREVEQPAIIGQLSWALVLMAIGLIVIFALERVVNRALGRSSSNSDRSKPASPSGPAGTGPSNTGPSKTGPSNDLSNGQSAKVATASSEAR